MPAVSSSTCGSPADRKRLVLLIGGARSGKSSYAGRLAPRLAHGLPLIYVATAQAGDDEMRERIQRHRAARPTDRLTIEVPLQVANALAAPADNISAGVVLLDCVTLWVSNLLLASLSNDTATVTDTESAAQRVWSEADALLALYRRMP